MDIFERIRTAPVRWIPVGDLLPDQWAKDFHYVINRVDGIKFKVLLSNGIQYYSYFQDGRWQITGRNPRLVVTHWVKPIFIA